MLIVGPAQSSRPSSPAVTVWATHRDPSRRWTVAGRGINFIGAVPDQGSCSPSEPISCDLGNIAVGAMVRITDNGTVNLANRGTLGLIAEVASSVLDSVGARPGLRVTGSTPIGGRLVQSPACPV